MLSRIHSLGSCLVVLTLLLFAGSAGAQDVSARCEAAMDRAAGDYSRCLLRADAHYARHENATKLENRQARCETRFDRRTSRAIRHHGADECPSSDLVAAMEDRTVKYAQGAATEASGTASPSFLYVQNATGGALSESTLTLTGVSSETGWFTDRPYRYAGQVPTEAFLTEWDEDQNSFADEPPNADFTCTSDEAAVNYFVELTNPVYEGGDLSYAVAGVGGTVLPQDLQCESDSHLFIDGGGCGADTKRKNFCPCNHSLQCASMCCAEGVRRSDLPGADEREMFSYGCLPRWEYGPDGSMDSAHPCVGE